jgi:alkaline phosphatase D
MLLIILGVQVGWGQVVAPYDLGGASRPKPDLTFRDADQYKRVHQTALRWILRGQTDKPEQFLKQFLDTQPADAETLYLLGILYGQQGDLDRAQDFLRRALAAGLPSSRLVAGPRAVFQPLMGTELLKAVHEEYAHQPVHGPLLGNATDTSVDVWVRTQAESEVRIMVSESENLTNGIHSQPVTSKSSEDFTAVARVSDLTPNTQYFYGIVIDGGPVKQSQQQRFRTLPTRGAPAKFVIAFGGGAGYVPANERMWDTIGRFDPQAILLLGDNVYIDDPESLVMQQYTYHRRQSRPEWQRLTAKSPVFTIWDDHDFGTNDSWGGPDVAIPFWKRDWVFSIFRQNWANPAYGGGDAHPGCYYMFQLADVTFFMLDCRYYRTDPRQSPRSMLGPVQLAWLQQRLRESTATFKVVCSSVPWDFRTKGDSLDTWNGFPEEHEQILSDIDRHQIEGVVLMSADRHRSDAWKISRPNGYDLYEFNSSRLTNQHIHPTMEKAGAIFSYNDPQSFGLVTFDTTLEDPQVTYAVVNIDGETPHSLTVRRSSLQQPGR